MAEVIGKNIAQRSIEKGVKEVAFDKGKYKYHGLIKILADSARTQGLIFKDKLCLKTKIKILVNIWLL